MTNATMALAELAEKGPDVDMLRQMVQFAAQRLMDMEAETLCGAGYDEKNPQRLNSRNGYRDRSWETRAGAVELRVPKLRQGSYYPAFLEPRRTAEKALAAVIQLAYVHGACPPARWKIWSRPWACLAFPRARPHACAPSLMNAWARS